MAYVPPSVSVTSVANSRIINLSEDTRIPAFVGAGPSARVVTDYPIARGSGAYDVLPVGSGSIMTLSQLAAYPGASVSNAAWAARYSLSGSNAVYWGAGTAGVNVPRNGETYYVSYTYPVTSSQYDAQTFTDSNDVLAAYGAEASGSLTTAANIALENGAPAVICVQIQGTGTLAQYQAAIDKLKKKSNIAYVIPLSFDASVQSAVLAHCNQESSPLIGHERSCILGMAPATAVGTFVSKATALKDKRAILVAPSSATRGTMTVNGTMIGAALAGLITAQPKLITPVTGKVLTGFTLTDDLYLPYEMNLMAGNGVCVITSQSGVVKIRHAITTDPTSADTREISVVVADDMVRRITRNKLTDAYIGKGIVISTSTPAQVAATVASIWTGLIRDGLIDAYGTTFDPSTGEVPISAVQDPIEPTRINVTGSVRFLYPLNYIDVTFFIYV